MSDSPVSTPAYSKEDNELISYIHASAQGMFPTLSPTIIRETKYTKENLIVAWKKRKENHSTSRDISYLITSGEFDSHLIEAPFLRDDFVCKIDYSFVLADNKVAPPVSWKDFVKLRELDPQRIENIWVEPVDGNQLQTLLHCIIRSSGAIAYINKVQSTETLSSAPVSPFLANATPPIKPKSSAFLKGIWNVLSYPLGGTLGDESETSTLPSSSTTIMTSQINPFTPKKEEEEREEFGRPEPPNAKRQKTRESQPEDDQQEHSVLL